MNGAHETICCKTQGDTLLISQKLKEKLKRILTNITEVDKRRQEMKKKKIAKFCFTKSYKIKNVYLSTHSLREICDNSYKKKIIKKLSSLENKQYY